MPRYTVRTVAQLKELEGSLAARAFRTRTSLISIIQASCSAGIAYFIATKVFGHEVPFFAPMAAVIILGLSSGGRIRRAVELSIGCSLGVGVGDLVILGIGTGDWQIALAVGVSLLIASFLSDSPLLVNQVATGSILIATIMPPGSASGPERMVDAVTGCVVGIIVMAIVPTSPLAGGRREVAKVLRIASSVLFDVASALQTGDAKRIEEALQQVRGSQAAINNMLLAKKAADESSKVSPFLWSYRRRVRSFALILSPVDNAVRNTRVLARRAMVLSQDGDKVSEGQIEIIRELAAVMMRLHDVYLKKAELSEAQEIPSIVKTLRTLGARGSLDVADGGVLSAIVILAQSRSIIVDLLQVCGMSRESAVAVLIPTSEHPAFPPEIWIEKSGQGENS